MDESPSFYCSITRAIIALATLAAAVFGIWKHFSEMKERRLWEKAKLAREMLRDLTEDEEAMNASYMLGAWNGRRYVREVNGISVSFQINQLQLIEVLNPSRQPKSDNENYVRQCFDELLFHLDLCVGAANRHIIEWEDIKPLFITLFAGVKRNTLIPLKLYATYSRYHGAESVLEEIFEAALTKRRPTLL